MPRQHRHRKARARPHKASRPVRPARSGHPFRFLGLVLLYVLSGWWAWARGKADADLLQPVLWAGLWTLVVVVAAIAWRPALGHGPGGAALGHALGVLLAWSAWARGGTQPVLQQRLVWVGLWTLTVFAAILLLRRTRGPGSAGAPPDHDRPGRLLADPILWAGAGFLFLLGLQWWNAGRVLFFDPFAKHWAYTLPPHPGWPFSVKRDEAWEMIAWFMPAWGLLLALRHAPHRVRLARRVIGFLLFSGVALGVFGIVQAATGTMSLFWLQPMKVQFFATFGYPNHAASYFVLLFALSAGLLLREWLQPYLDPAFVEHYPGRKPPRLGSRARIAWYAVASMATLAAANLSLSRAGMLFSWVIVLAVLVYGMGMAWSRLGTAGRVNLCATLLGILILSFFVVEGIGGRLMRETVLQAVDAKAGEETGARWWQAEAAVEMWKEHRAFGVGGWGYRYFLPLVVPETRRPDLTDGKANAHNDPAQFLAEFGAVGGALLAVIVVTLAVGFLRRALHPTFLRNPLAILSGLGLGAVFVHSLFDLPFRSPGVLYAWLAVFAAVPYLMPRPAAVPAPGPMVAGDLRPEGSGVSRTSARAEGSEGRPPAAGVSGVGR